MSHLCTANILASIKVLLYDVSTCRTICGI